MNTTNLVEEVIIPETPNAVENQVLHFFVPLGNYNYPGALKPFNRHFDLYDQGLFKINLANLSTDLRLERFDDKVDRVNPRSSGHYRHSGPFSVYGDFVANNYLNPKTSGVFEHTGDFTINGNFNADSVDCYEIKTDLFKILQNGMYRNFNDFVSDFVIKRNPETSGNFKHDGRFSCTGNVVCNDITSENYGFFKNVDAEFCLIDELHVKQLYNTDFLNVKQMSTSNRTNLINLSAQVKGISRTYVIPNFMTFINFINGRYSIPVHEDFDGEVNTYNISVSDLKTGDNIIIVEHNVPDFWFDKTTDFTTKETYVYNGQEYELVAPNGLMHKSETDYVIIGNYAQSASVSADEARQSASEAKDSEDKSTQLFQSVNDLVNSIYIKQVAPPLSLLDKAIILTTPTLAQI